MRILPKPMTLCTTCLYILLIPNIVNAQFIATDYFPKSDMNYTGIAKINEFSPEEMLDSVFNTKAGKYKIYRFMNASIIEDKDSIFYMNRTTTTVVGTFVGTFKTKLEIIVVKVKGNRIIEAYYYPLNWREYPFSSVLLVSNKKLKLKRERWRWVNVDNLNFKNYDIDSQENRLEKGATLFFGGCPGF